MHAVRMAVVVPTYICKLGWLGLWAVCRACAYKRWTKGKLIHSRWLSGAEFYDDKVISRHWRQRRRLSWKLKEGDPKMRLSVLRSLSPDEQLRWRPYINRSVLSLDEQVSPPLRCLRLALAGMTLKIWKSKIDVCFGQFTDRMSIFGWEEVNSQSLATKNKPLSLLK